MTNIFIIVVLLVVFFFIIQKYVIKHDDTCDYPYRAKGPLLRGQEGAFFNALRAAVGEHAVVFAKVNMSTLVAPKDIKNKKQFFVANNRIARSYFDYVICDPRTLEPRVIIEFDNGQQLNKGKVERQKLLMHVCKSANLPLIGTSVKHSYQVGRLRRLLAAHIDLIEPEKEVRFCKKCGSPMIIKTASQGEFKGRRFFTCSRQPNCTYTENYNVVFESDD
ncbi:DUF2726 domain-containing protein [Vibrio parahaemolyticus]|uniref:DUF2726 domain-containing protein n=1 Tax=Vibrio parahaemolyticus TaxID=670 RepID=UPI001EEA9122|nr:DUF2726 domain-containing protein [Vibrio parahaemolyticus]MCG6453870.1 DUF2726 domain-containing protein [Vibrio parahaemolyticus]